MKNEMVKKQWDITASAFQQFTIDETGSVEVAIHVASDIQSQLFVECVQAESVQLRVTLEQGAECTLFFWNQNNQTMTFDDQFILKRNAVLNLSYGELANGDFKRKTHVILKEEGASASLYTATLSSSTKNYEILCEHAAPHTESNMKNYFVLLKGGTCSVDAIGKINKGAHGAKSHQVSRGLTFDQQKRAMILPQLLIDENDVEASHATTLGQLDENQMYYLQSRGLSRNEATQLITFGYLLPVTDNIENEELKAQCREEIEMKVNQSCSM